MFLESPGNIGYPESETFSGKFWRTTSPQIGGGTINVQWDAMDYDSGGMAKYLPLDSIYVHTIELGGVYSIYFSGYNGLIGSTTSNGSRTAIINTVRNGEMCGGSTSPTGTGGFVPTAFWIGYLNAGDLIYLSIKTDNANTGVPFQIFMDDGSGYVVISRIGSMAP
jgi:hypothetical protein